MGTEELRKDRFLMRTFEVVAPSRLSVIAQLLEVQACVPQLRVGTVG